MPTNKYLAALDTDFVLMLEAGHDGCARAYKVLENRGCSFILTETPLQELQEMAQHGSNPQYQQLATSLIPKLYAEFGITPDDKKNLSN